MESTRMVVSLTKDELARLLDVAKAHSFLDYLMLLVTFNHGLRVSEVCGPTGLSSANLDGNLLVVQREKRSHKTTQPLLPNEKEFLANLVGPWFPITRMTYWRRMQKYCKAAGIPRHKAHPHALKHTTGRLGFLGGMSVNDVGAYLGHKVLGNSLIYMKSSEEEAANAFAAAMGG
jgi:integrase